MAAKETWKHEQITQVKYFNARLDRTRILVNATNSLAASTNHLGRVVQSPIKLTQG